MSTWDEIRARSEHDYGGMKVFCGDCSVHFQLVGLPCLKHATPDEIKLIEASIAKTFRGTR